MMAKAKKETANKEAEEAVKYPVGVKEMDGSWAGICMAKNCSFVSRGWPNRDVAEARILEHRQEHIGGVDQKTKLAKTPMSLLSEFRDQHKLIKVGGQVVLASDVEIVADGSGTVGGS